MASTEKNQRLIEIAKGLDNVPWCDQYERMISGMLYECTTPELEKGRFRARAWCNKYNTTFPLDDPDATLESLAKDRFHELKKILGAVGEDAFIEPPFYLDYGCNVILGERFYANFNLVILDCSLISIGNRVFFGPYVSIYAATHETEVQSRRDNIEFAREVTIGDDCWIGGNVTILPGVEIGEGCTIGAGSVVTKSIPPWSVAVGSPARVIKKVTPVDKMESSTSVKE